MKTLALSELAGGLSQSKPFAGYAPATEADTRKILLIRHGSTALNGASVSTDRIRGWKDIPLTLDGEREAERLAHKIDPPDVLVASDLCRTVETAKIISRITGVPLMETTKSFRPWNVGDYAGMASEKAIPILADYAENKPDEPIPGGESFNDFRTRFIEGLKETLEKYQGVVGIVTHHRGERLMHAWRVAGYPPDGSIDIKTFNQKGEAPATAQAMTIPVAALQRFEQSVNDGGMLAAMRA